MLGTFSDNVVHQSDHAILKFYNDSCYKLIMMKSCRLPGFEPLIADTKGKRNSAGNCCKLDASLSRTRSKVYELALCNKWEYFITLTLSPENGDRQNLKQFKRSLSKWLNNLNFRNGWSIKYMLIPEPHKDGSWHMHGLLTGVPDHMLVPFSAADHLPYSLLGRIKRGEQIFNWPAYAEKFGYVTCDRIRDPEACAKYITKYITKELGERNAKLNEKLYLCSHGLKRAKTVLRGRLVETFTPDFSNEYVAIKTFRTYEEAAALFGDAGNIFGPASYVGFLDVVQPIIGGEKNWTFCPQV